MNNKEKISNYIRSLGLNTFGFTECRIFHELEEYYNYRKMNNLNVEFEDDNIENRINPFLLMNQGKTIISIAFPYFHKENKNIAKFSKYTLGEDYHLIVNKYLDLICNYINDLGGEANAFVDNNPLPERYIAYLSGLGFVGKNNTFITKEYGSYIFLGEIITSLKLENDKPVLENCENCDLCLKVCPTGVLHDKLINNNFNGCLSYITQKKNIDDIYFNKIKIFGCDICQDICPFNKEIKDSFIESFKAFNFIKEDSLIDIISLDNKSFKEKYKKCSCGWRGKNILIRNALINYHYKNKEDKDDLYKLIKSPYIKEYYDKLFKKEED